MAKAHKFLPQYSKEDVQAWFKGQPPLVKFAPKFKDWNGENMAKLTEEQLQKAFDNLDGSAIYNALQTVKMPTKGALPLPPPKTRN